MYTALRRDRQSSTMEHRGIPYQVVQTASPTGYRWTVQLDADHVKTGTSSSKGNAIFQAVRAIDKTIGTKTETPIDLAGEMDGAS
jgi:deoxyribose-phosphate aldolase